MNKKKIAGKILGVNIVIFSIAMATVHINFFFFRPAMPFPIVLFFIRIALLRHFIIVTFPLPLSRSNPIRHLFSNFIVTSQLKTVKNLAIMMIFLFCILFCINYSLSHFVTFCVNRSLN